MNILKMQKKANSENVNSILEARFYLKYYLRCNLSDLSQSSENKTNLKNYWLQKRENKEQEKEHNAKLDKIAKFITKYINDRKQ